MTKYVSNHLKCSFKPCYKRKVFSKHWIFSKLFGLPFFLRIEVLRAKMSHTVSVSNKMHFTYAVKTD